MELGGLKGMIKEKVQKFGGVIISFNEQRFNERNLNIGFGLS